MFNSCALYAVGTTWCVEWYFMMRLIYDASLSFSDICCRLIFFFYYGVGLGEEDALSCDNLWHSEQDALEAESLCGKFGASEGFPTLSPLLLVWFTAKCCALIAEARAKIAYLPYWTVTYDDNFDDGPSDFCYSRFNLQSRRIVLPDPASCPSLNSKNIVPVSVLKEWGYLKGMLLLFITKSHILTWDPT